MARLPTWSYITCIVNWSCSSATFISDLHLFLCMDVLLQILPQPSLIYLKLIKPAHFPKPYELISAGFTLDFYSFLLSPSFEWLCMLRMTLWLMRSSSWPPGLCLYHQPGCFTYCLFMCLLECCPLRPCIFHMILGWQFSFFSIIINYHHHPYYYFIFP